MHIPRICTQMTGTSLVCLALLASQVAPAYAAPHAAVLTAAKACEPAARELLGQLVRIDSGTGDTPGLAAMGAILKSQLEQVGARVEQVPAVPPAVGDNLVATLNGTGKGRILLIAHMDTVFAHGTVAQRPYKIVDEHGIGPGAGDDKSGIAAAACALRVLRDVNFRDYARITLILNSNEETGSWGTRDLIRKLASQSDVAINLERGTPEDGLVVGRKGSAVVTLEISGRAAHSGLEPEKGRNAVVEAAHQALRISSLGDASKETTVNVTMFQGGNAINVIPDHAVVTADVRAFTAAEFDRVEAGIAQLAHQTTVPDIVVKSAMKRNFPPWPPAASTGALLARAQRLYAEIDRKLDGVPVGSSADVAFAAETGVPSIDGFGLVGGGAHGADDYADLSSIVPRVYLLARMLMDLGHAP
jgi:glutamate carboxypeptidase